MQDGGMNMRLQTVQDALNQKNIRFEYTEEDGCGSLDFMFRGLKFHVWEYHDGVWLDIEQQLPVFLRRLPARRRDVDKAQFAQLLDKILTLCAMLHLVSMPPRPNDDLLVCTYSDRSSLLPSISRITVEDGSDGLPLYIPSILLRIIKASIPIMVAISPESSSLSVNISSLTEIVSFSLTMGMTPFSSITVIQFF